MLAANAAAARCASFSVLNRRFLSQPLRARFLVGIGAFLAKPDLTREQLRQFHQLC